MAWSLPIDVAHTVASSAGPLSFVGGAADFNAAGEIRQPGSLTAQIAGAMENVGIALGTEGCTLEDVVRLKAFYKDDGSADALAIVAALLDPVASDPPPGSPARQPRPVGRPGRRLRVRLGQRKWERHCELLHISLSFRLSTARRFGEPG